MMHTMPWPAQFFWSFVTRLGEAEILLPVALLTALACCMRPERRQRALVWMGLLGLATLLTAATKIAFIGWGLGWAALNFTGVSGHTMFASAIYPMLALTFLAGGAPASRRRALLLGCLLAVVVGVSRIAVGAHSWSEVMAGWLVGGSVTAVVLASSEMPAMLLPPLLPLALLAWVGLTPAQMQASQSHSLVTRVALGLSGHAVPYTREALMPNARKGSS